jgi:hypothetical protein
MAVEFCTECKESLPRGDLTIKEGRVYTSHDYICPHCGQQANPNRRIEKPVPEPAPERDLVIREGEVRSESSD